MPFLNSDKVYAIFEVTVKFFQFYLKLFKKKEKKKVQNDKNDRKMTF